ncbi:HDOD domain-containing protein [Denitratisoma sp. agr-D3]
MQELVARGLKIPPWPKVLQELQQALASGRDDIRTLAHVIGQDPGIAAMLFKVANSPAFAKGQSDFERLDQVLMVLGVKQALNLVQAVSLSTSLNAENRPAFDLFWNRSAEVAIIAAMIAEDRLFSNKVSPDQAYLAGIFRECGIPILMQRFPDYCEAVTLEEMQCGPSVVTEDQRYGMDHAVIGYLVARHWKLPDFVATSIFYHGDMPDAAHDEVRTLVAILHLANHYYNYIHHRDTPHWDEVKDDVLAELGLHPAEEEEFRADIEIRFNNMA